MSTDKGYIKLYRDIRDHWVWSEKPFSRGQAWIDLLMMVNHEEKTISYDGHPMKVGRGQKVTSLKQLADRWGWSRAKVRRFFDDLESEQMLTTKRNARGTTVTVVNYGFYQGQRYTDGYTHEYTDGYTDEHTDGLQTRTKEELKKNEERITGAAGSAFSSERE